MFCLVIFLCMFTNNAPLKLVHSFASDPSGGGVLHRPARPPLAAAALVAICQILYK